MLPLNSKLNISCTQQLYGALKKMLCVVLWGELQNRWGFLSLRKHVIMYWYTDSLHWAVDAQRVKWTLISLTFYFLLSRLWRKSSVVVQVYENVTLSLQRPPSLFKRIMGVMRTPSARSSQSIDSDHSGDEDTHR